MIKKRPKYGNKRVVIDGITFDSTKEGERYLVLKQAQKDGIISELELQPVFEFIPKITENYVKHLKTKDKICERTVQLPITYKADFKYKKGAVMVVEDVKGSDYMCTEVFKLKEKLFRWKFGFSIRRVYNSCDEV